MDDLSWIEEESKINEIQNFDIFPENMRQIYVHCVYINEHLEIEDKITHCIDLDQIKDGSGTILSKERLLYLIQTNKLYTPTTQYKFTNGLIYHIDVLPSHLQQYIKDVSNNYDKSLKEFYMVDDIIIRPSLSIFHSINAIYLFFKEGHLKSKLSGNGGKTVRLKPILKPCGGVSSPLNTDKSTATDNTNIVESELNSAVDLDLDLNTNKKRQTKRVRISETSSLNKSKKNKSND